jgi:hypothetical protein
MNRPATFRSGPDSMSRTALRPTQWPIQWVPWEGVKDEKVDLLADPHKIVNKWMNYFCQLLNVQWVGV